MVVKYSYKKDKDKKLSSNFSVYEFRSVYGQELTTDDIFVDNILIKKLEALKMALNASKAIITSGYRNKECDLLVGGTGNGQHCLGKASDVMFYDKDGNIIDTKYISCVAQEIGFNGIARISNTSIHLDVRDGKRYLGDETKSTNTVTKDFYDYYKINRLETLKKIVKENACFADETIDFLCTYKYSEDLLKKILLFCVDKIY